MRLKKRNVEMEEEITEMKQAVKETQRKEIEIRKMNDFLTGMYCSE